MRKKCTRFWFKSLKETTWKTEAQMVGWNQNGSLGDWLGGSGMDSSGSGKRLVAGSCEDGDEPLGSGTMKLVNTYTTYLQPHDTAKTENS
jgi:hypothetical protein